MAYLKKNKTALKDSTIGFALGAFIVLGVFVYSLFTFAAWNNPTQAPTGGNVLAPLNSSSTAQYKLGSLMLGSTTPVAYVSNLFLYNGEEAIGTSTIGVTGLLVANSGHNVNVIDVNTNRITNLIQVPINPSEAASMAYVDARVNATTLWSGLTSTNIYNANTGYNVGIGTSSPPQVLSVGSRTGTGGVIQQSSPNGGRNGILFARTSGVVAGIGIDSNNTGLQLFANASTLSDANADLTILANGYVGIGTTTPPQALSVGSRSAAGGIIQQSSSNGNRNGILFARTSGVVAGIGIDSNNTGLQLFANASTLNDANADLTILANGNVGLGTTNPGAGLDVENGNNVLVGGLQYPSITIKTNNNTTDGSSGFYQHGWRQLSSGDGPIASFYGYNDKGSAVNAIAAIYFNRETTDTYGGITFLTRGAAGTLNQQMQINNAGNVGIATSSSGIYVLDVKGVGRFSTSSISAFSTLYALDVKGLAKFSKDVYVGGQVIVNSGDLAEDFYVDKVYSPGTVLVMNDKPSYAEASAGEGYKSARACDKKYDPTVIGVVSEKPGLVIGQLDSKYKAPVALTGVVKVLVNNSGGQINPGDLLTTSAISGEAMKATNAKLGTTIGKALEADSGKGWIMAIVNLK